MAEKKHSHTHSHAKLEHGAMHDQRDVIIKYAENELRNRNERKRGRGVEKKVEFHIECAICGAFVAKCCNIFIPKKKTRKTAEEMKTDHH